MSDDARSKIVQRRARFLAAAVATVGIGAVSCSPRPCLSQVQPRTDATPSYEDSGTITTPTASDADVPPQPCLSVLPPDEDPAPHPCLSVSPPQPDPDAGPQPCLKIKPKP